MAEPAIDIENLTKDYPYGFLQLKKRRSLESLTMQVQTGEVFGFLGPNGAGKSTTIKLLMRLIFPTAGSARILGKPISDIAMHRNIGYLPEQPYFYDYLTAAEVLDYFARFHDFDATERRERVQRMLKKVGLESAGRIQLRKYSKGMLQRVGINEMLFDRYPSQISGGQCQRVLIARALVLQPKILLLENCVVVAEKRLRPFRA